MEELVEIITCRQCGQQKQASRRSPHMCVDCEKAYNNRYSYIRKRNGDWQEIAKENGLELWERQPGETQLEWTIWLAYRDSYPGSKPNYRQAAEKAGSTYDFVVNTASRWSFQIRMQAWIAECDRITLAQRREEVLAMNADHIAMATKLRNKMHQAIDQLRPEDLKPAELNSLLKTMAELERKAQTDSMAMETQQGGGFVDNENTDLKKSPTKQGDLSEVLGILLKAGALGDVSQIGVRQTTEVVVKDSDGNSASLET